MMIIAFNFFMLLLVVCAIAILTAKELLTSVIIFGAFSFFSALFFVLLGALDVAFTEAAVGAAITTIFFIVSLHVTRQEKLL